MIILKTNYGDIHLSLNTQTTTKTVENFLTYIHSGFFDNTIFHRVIDGFMIQGGGFVAHHDHMHQKNSEIPTIENEADQGLSNLTGTIAMARTMDPHSASHQFFINLKDNTFLDHQSKTPQGWGYCAFGRVVQGMDVVEKIGKVKTGSQGGHDDVPLEPVTLLSALIVDPTTNDPTTIDPTTIGEPKTILENIEI